MSLCYIEHACVFIQWLRSLMIRLGAVLGTITGRVMWPNTHQSTSTKWKDDSYFMCTCTALAVIRQISISKLIQNNFTVSFGSSATLSSVSFLCFVPQLQGQPRPCPQDKKLCPQGGLQQCLTGSRGGDCCREGSRTYHTIC